MQVLSVTSECAPLVKTGGLADVAGALPVALAGQGVRMRTLLPGYPDVMREAGAAELVLSDPDLFGGPARVLAARAGGLDLLILDAPHLYDREGGPYLTAEGEDWPDNPERFAALSWIGARIAAGGLDDWRPDVLHAHDWQAALAPYYLKRQHGGGCPSILTIHNIAFAGLALATKIAALRLDREDFHQNGYEFWGQASALKAGLIFADRLSTVSPTYAAELMRPDFGMGLDGVMRMRRDDLSGILNGIDTETWDPRRDAHAHNFRTIRGKARAREDLRDEFDLPDAPGPLAVVISRLTRQKGLDLLLEALPGYLHQGGRLALLGSGDRALERAWRDAAVQHDNLAVRIGYDEALSHRMIAGADAVLVPSRFEPCGLTQLMGLRYGAVPVVAATGGLADTVIDANHAALSRGVATGLQFHPIDTENLYLTLDRLVTLHADGGIWSQITRNAMRHPVGWEVSAAAYAALYEDLTDTA